MTVVAYADRGANNRQPLEWTQRQGNVSFYSRKAPQVIGGHFPAYINPRALAEDCWAFWGNESRSGSGIFRME